MKRFENVKMVLFDSTNAYFKLAVEAQFTRKNPDGSYRDLVYTTDRGTSILNPNIYLTLSYKDDNLNAVYTSYPQLYLLRNALETVKNKLLDPAAFFVDPNDNSLSVKQTYEDAVIIDNIGKSNNWISMKLCAIRTGENGVFTYSKGVILELSTSNGWKSQLSQEEFLTVYTIIKDLNLSTIQCMLSLGFLNGDARQVNNYNGGYQQQQPGGYYGQTTPGYPPQNQGYMQQPQQNFRQSPPMNGNWAGQQQVDQSQYMRPRFNSQPRTPSYRTPAAQSAPAAQQQIGDFQPTHYVDNSNTTALPARNAEKPVMNMKAIEETPVSSYDVDDAAAIASIFND